MELWAAVGCEVGKVSAALRGLEHPAAHREFSWDLAACEQVVALRAPSVEEARQPLLQRCVANFREHVGGLLPRLRKSVVHNDPNDYNLVVDDDGRLCDQQRMRGPPWFEGS